MEYFERKELMDKLSEEFGVSNVSDVNMAPNNYITSTKTLDCGALGIDVESLEKKAVIDLFYDKFSTVKNRSNDNSQYLIHLTIAKKCVEKILSQKRRVESDLWAV